MIDEDPHSGDEISTQLFGSPEPKWFAANWNLKFYSMWDLKHYDAALDLSEWSGFRELLRMCLKQLNQTQ
jgi:hypothetical protein